MGWVEVISTFAFVFLHIFINAVSIGCFFKDEDEKHLRGYNEVCKPAIKERIDKTVLDEAMRRATEKDSDASQ